MAAMDNQHIQEFDKSLAGWTDERMVSRADIRAHTMFLVYLVNLSAGDGWTYDGHSLKVGVPMSTLTVKATIDGVPSVVFSSGRTTTSCIRAFLRKMEEGWLEWVRDKYR